MASTTVSTKIVVEFDDRFTQSANKALENYKRTLEEIKRVQENENLKVVDSLFEKIASVEPFEMQIISPNVLQQFGEIERVIRLFEGQNQLSLHIDLIDEATEDALKIRKKLEETYNTPITQIINIKRVSSSFSSLLSSDFSTSNDSGEISTSNSPGFDGPGNFDGSSINPEGFDTFGSLKGFSTGIDRVPRDMLAVIHKDETVLTKAEAEERRQGGSVGMAIQSVNINMNVPDSFNSSNMSRQNFRQFALQVKDELRRLDRRMSL